MNGVYITKMAENLKIQCKEYSKMLVYAENKRQALIKADMKSLEQTTKQEETMIKKIGVLELERIEIQKKLAQNLNLPVEDLNWQQLEKSLSEAEKNTISECTQELKTVIGKLSDINSINKNLLDQSLKLIHTTMNTISGETEKTYTNKPTQNKPKEGKIFDIKA